MDWILAPFPALLLVIVSTLGAYVAMVAMTRVTGLRSFSKLNRFDFPVTIAIGSVLAAMIISDDPPLIQGLFALGALFLIQLGTGELRHRFKAFEHLIGNKPRLVWVNGAPLWKAMHKAKITELDLYAKLREANVVDPSDVHAVVAETNGEVSVLYGPRGSQLAPAMLKGVIGAELLDEDRNRDL